MYSANLIANMNLPVFKFTTFVHMYFILLFYLHIEMLY